MGCTALQHRHRTGVFGNCLRYGPSPKGSSKSSDKSGKTEVPQPENSLGSVNILKLTFVVLVIFTLFGLLWAGTNKVLIQSLRQAHSSESSTSLVRKASSSLVVSSLMILWSIISSSRQLGTFTWGATGEQPWDAILSPGMEGKSIIWPACLPITTNYSPDERALNTYHGVTMEGLKSLQDEESLPGNHTRPLLGAHIERKRIDIEVSARRECPIESILGVGARLQFKDCSGSLTALCCKDLVWMKLALPVVTSMQAVDRKKELWFMGEKSYKMTGNVKEIDSVGNLVVIIPAEKYGKSFDGEFERIEIVSEVDNLAAQMLKVEEDGDEDEDDAESDVYDDEQDEFQDLEGAIFRMLGTGGTSERDQENVMMIGHVDDDPLLDDSANFLQLLSGMNSGYGTSAADTLSHPLIMGRTEQVVPAGSARGQGRSLTRQKGFRHIQLNPRNGEGGPGMPAILQSLLGLNSGRDLLQQNGNHPGRNVGAIRDATRVLVMESGSGFDSLEDEIPGIEGLGQGGGSALSTVPNALVRWTEESRVLDGDSLHDCTTVCKPEFLYVIEMKS